jgi:putative tryptophan/tyrosine transport system substrate-binding protein
VRRREFIALVGSAAAAWPLTVVAQQKALPVVGFLNGQSPSLYAHYVDIFRLALNTAGFIEGRDVVIEYRWAEGQYDKLPALAADLVSRRVNVIAATGTTAAVLAAKAATATIPIIFTSGGDPVKAGLVPNLKRPGGNVTGVSFLVNETGSKQLELLCEMVPSAKSVGLLVNPKNPNMDAEIADVIQAARVLGRQIQVVNATTEAEIDGAFATFVQQHVNAIIVLADAFFIARSDQVVALAARNALPAIYSLSEQARVGGLMSYGSSQGDAYRQAGIYAARVLKGEKPGDLPALLPTKFEFVINLKTAKALGIRVPPDLSARADEVIE